MTAVTAYVHESQEAAQREPVRHSEVLDGRYRVLGFIGAGSMGEVYEGEHLQIGRRVALKFLRRSLALHERMIDQFRFEARVAGQLSSDHVASVLDFGVTQDGAVYMVMERLHGETLAQRLERSGVLKPVEAARLIAQACLGAQAAHNVGIVHCDLKPSNMILARGEDGSERVKLLDFGICRLSTRAAGLRSAPSCRNAGTPRYMSPEQAAADPRLDGRTDVYSLGVILYQSLTGRFPHAGQDPVAIRCHVVREDAVPLQAVAPSIPAELARIVDHALARAAVDRYASARHLADALQAFIAHSSTIADASTCVRSNVATLTDPPSLDEVGASSWAEPPPTGYALQRSEPITNGASQPGPALRAAVGRAKATAAVAATGLVVALLGWVCARAFPLAHLAGGTTNLACRATSLHASGALAQGIPRSLTVVGTGSSTISGREAVQETGSKPAEARTALVERREQLESRKDAIRAASRDGRPQQRVAERIHETVSGASDAAGGTKETTQMLVPTLSIGTQANGTRLPRPLALERENPYGRER